jgi:hypothetical protein
MIKNALSIPSGNGSEPKRSKLERKKNRKQELEKPQVGEEREEKKWEKKKRERKESHDVRIVKYHEERLKKLKDEAKENDNAAAAARPVQMDIIDLT